jgi:muramoyltetrapeptide carboxypeptidase
MAHDHSALIGERFRALGLDVSFGEHVDEQDAFQSSSRESRIADLHAAFREPDVAGILTVIGGFSSNELLADVDWELVAANPKVFCGFSDITALQNAMLARGRLVTYSGPHWSTFGMRDHFEQTLAWFRAAVFDEVPITIEPAATWTDDEWFIDQRARDPRPNDGWWALRPGDAEGEIVGGNLCTLNLLQGTPFMPSLDGALLLLEDDADSHPAHFARDLTSLLQLPDAAGIRGLVIGRFQRASGMSRSLLEEIIARQSALADRPVLANADFGHTSPLATFPIGGRARVHVGLTCRFTITRH